MTWTFFSRLKDLLTGDADRRHRRFLSSSSIAIPRLHDGDADRLLERIELLGYQVSVRRRQRAGGEDELQLCAADSRTGESHIVRIDSSEPQAEQHAVAALAELVASDLEG